MPKALAKQKRNVAVERSEEELVFDTMRPVVHAIARALGRHCEVILTDFRTPNSAVVEIAGNLSSRKIGDPVNELNQWLLSHGRDVNATSLEFSRSPRGQTLKTSRTVFRRSDGTAFGCLCINIDVTAFLAVGRSIADLVSSEMQLAETPPLTNDISSVIQAALTSEEERTGRRLDIAAPSDRAEIFGVLKQYGVFALKKAVPRVATHFGLSRATIYSYLKQADDASTSADGAAPREDGSKLLKLDRPAYDRLAK